MKSCKLIYRTLCLALVMLPGISNASDWYVAGGGAGSEQHDCKSKQFPCAAIQDAINRAAAGDKIWVAPYNYQEKLIINKPINIEGTYAVNTSLYIGPVLLSATLTGKQSARTLEINGVSGTVEFKNFKFLDGDASKETKLYGIGGCATILDSSDVRFTGVEFNNCIAFSAPKAADAWGGAIYSSNSNITIDRSVFLGNKANNSTVAGGGSGGAIASAYSLNLSVTNSNFGGNIANNSATATSNITTPPLSQGGAIAVSLDYNQLADVYIRNSIFAENKAGGPDRLGPATGGAISFGGVGNYANLYVEKSKFENNVAAECRFSKVSVPGLPECAYEAFDIIESWGGQSEGWDPNLFMYMDGGSSSLYFNEDQCQTEEFRWPSCYGYGGDIATYGDKSVSFKPNFTVVETDFNGSSALFNNAIGQGQGGSIDTYNAEFFIDRSRFDSATAVNIISFPQPSAGFGGAISIHDSPSTLSNLVFYNNQATKYANHNYTIGNLVGYGGAVAVTDAATKINHITAAKNGGESYIPVAEFDYYSTKANTISNSLITNGEIGLKNWSTQKNLTFQRILFFGLGTAVQGPANGNINQIPSADPQFLDQNSGDFRLQTASPAKNIYTPISSDLNYDIDGTYRPIGAKSDLGAYEFHQGNITVTASSDKQVINVGEIVTVNGKVYAGGQNGAGGVNLSISFPVGLSLSSEPPEMCLQKSDVEVICHFDYIYPSAFEEVSLSLVGNKATSGSIGFYGYSAAQNDDLSDNDVSLPIEVLAVIDDDAGDGAGGDTGGGAGGDTGSGGGSDGGGTDGGSAGGESGGGSTGGGASGGGENGGSDGGSDTTPEDGDSDNGGASNGGNNPLEYSILTSSVTPKKLKKKGFIAVNLLMNQKINVPIQILVQTKKGKIKALANCEPKSNACFASLKIKKFKKFAAFKQNQKSKKRKRLWVSAKYNDTVQKLATVFLKIAKKD